MCGRYTQTLDLRALQERFHFAACRSEPTPRYNIAPTQPAPVVLADAGRVLDALRWGLIPAWAKDMSIGHKLINARAESVAEKPAFKAPFRKSRCLVLADGFYEWRPQPGERAKIPLRFTLPAREPFAMAGLWDSRQAPDGAVVRSFAIITTQANAALRSVHDRMPVILRREDEDAWLDPEAAPADLSRLLVPYPGELACVEVSPLVNSPKADLPACIEEVRR
ncbi:MAG: SOS response-associated peptidase [Elusimicrobia bacterium]|nr:SOS response-associated peptidase [Elusimicrobiota bacterium]